MRFVLLALLLTILTPLRSWAQPTTSPTAPPDAANQVLSPIEARAERERIDAKLKLLDEQARSFKMAGPLAATIASATLLTASFGGLALSAYEKMEASDGIEEDVRPNDRLRMRLFGSSVALFTVTMIISWITLAQRADARKAVRLEAKKLRGERQRLQVMIAPEVGPSRYALSLTSRFW